MPFKPRLHASNDSVDPSKPEQDREELPAQDVGEQRHRDAHMCTYPPVPVSQVQIQQSRQHNDRGEIDTRHDATGVRVGEEEVARGAPRRRALCWEKFFEILRLRSCCFANALPAGQDPVLQGPCELGRPEYGGTDPALDDEAGAEPSHTVAKGHHAAEHYEAGIPEEAGRLGGGPSAEQVGVNTRQDRMVEDEDGSATETGVEEAYAQEEDLKLDGRL